MRTVSDRRARRAQALRDRAVLLVVGALAVGGTIGFGWLSRQIGVPIMKWILFGGFLIVAAGLALMLLRMRELGIRPPSLRELKQADAAEARPQDEVSERP